MYNLHKVGKLMYDIRQPDRLAEWKRDPEAMMDKYGLSEEDRGPIRAKVSQPFFDAGLHPILLGGGSRAMGLPGMMSMGRMSPGNTPPVDGDERKKFASEIAKEFNLVTTVPAGR